MKGINAARPFPFSSSNFLSILFTADRVLLKEILALFELAISGQTPVKVAINEAVELAKLFGSDSSARFVNGVLGAVVPFKDELAAKAQESSDSQPEEE